jgi:hypothetical protein
VIFTGDWSLPVKEAEATSSVVDQGADVVTCHVAMGFSVWKIRLACITAGSFLAGIGGAYLSLFYPGGWNKRSLAGAPGALGKDI